MQIVSTTFFIDCPPFVVGLYRYLIYKGYLFLMDRTNAVGIAYYWMLKYEYEGTDYEISETYKPEKFVIMK